MDRRVSRRAERISSGHVLWADAGAGALAFLAGGCQNRDERSDARLFESIAARRAQAIAHDGSRRARPRAYGARRLAHHAGGTSVLRAVGSRRAGIGDRVGTSSARPGESTGIW